MALASDEDVENALGRALTESEDVATLLETASDLVIGYLGQEPDPVPDPVARVVADMVAAVLTKPAATAADYGTLISGGYNVARETMPVKIGVESATSTGPWLTKSLKTRLQPYKTTGSRAAYSVVLIDENDPPIIPTIEDDL